MEDVPCLPVDIIEDYVCLFRRLARGDLSPRCKLQPSGGHPDQARRVAIFKTGHRRRRHTSTCIIVVRSLLLPSFSSLRHVETSGGIRVGGRDDKDQSLLLRS